jgi:hypothetical protein
MTDSESTQLAEIIPHVKVLIDPDQESSLFLSYLATQAVAALGPSGGTALLGA